MPNVYQLYKLQQLDSRIDAVRRRLKEIAANLVETQALKTAKAEFAAAEASLNQARADAVDLDLEVKGLQQKIAKHEKRLYSGSISNPKEAASLQQEIASTKRWLAKREEDLLEAMIAQEDAETQLAEKEKTLADIRRRWETEQSDLLAEKKTLEAELAQLTADRQQQAGFIERATLSQYETLRQKKGGVAVTGVKDDTCVSCGVMLSQRMLQAAEDDSTLCYCEGCGRILFIL